MLVRRAESSQVFNTDIVNQIALMLCGYVSVFCPPLIRPNVDRALCIGKEGLITHTIIGSLLGHCIRRILHDIHPRVLCSPMESPQQGLDSAALGLWSHLASDFGMATDQTMDIVDSSVRLRVLSRPTMP